jgi:hypothetical protein
MRRVASRTKWCARSVSRQGTASCRQCARGVVLAGVWFCAAGRAWRGRAAGCVGFAPSASRITSASSRPPSARARACHLVSVLGVVGCGTLRGAAAAYPRAVRQTLRVDFTVLQGEPTFQNCKLWKPKRDFVFGGEAAIMDKQHEGGEAEGEAPPPKACGGSEATLKRSRRSATSARSASRADSKTR